MDDMLEGNKAARAAVLENVRKALGRTDPSGASREAALAYLSAHAMGPRPAVPADPVACFRERATAMASTVERIGAIADIPAAVARYLHALAAPDASAAHPAHAGVCWPEFAALDWRAAGLDIEARPTSGHDRLGITGCFCAIAETGTLVFTAGSSTPSATMLLPDTHVCVVRATRIVPGMEDAFALVRAEPGGLPRAVNLVSGPSRTGDIEQTIVLGAHGPFRVHILLLDQG